MAIRGQVGKNVSCCDKMGTRKGGVEIEKIFYCAIAFLL